MQLLFNANTDISIERNMAAIEQETLSLQEKFTDNIIEKLSDDTPCIAEDNSLDTDICKNNEDSKRNDSVDQSNDNQEQTSNVESNCGDCTDNVLIHESDKITLDINCEKHTTEEQKIDQNTEINHNTVEELNADIRENETESTISNVQNFMSEEEDENNSIYSIENNKEEIENKENKIDEAEHSIENHEESDNKTELDINITKLNEKTEETDMTLVTKDSIEETKEEIEKIKPDSEVDFFKEFDVTKEDKINEAEFSIENMEESDNKTGLDINITRLHEKTEETDMTFLTKDSIENNKEEIEKVKSDFVVDFFKESDMTKEDKINESENSIENHEESENKTELDINITELHDKTEEIDMTLVTKNEISNIEENTFKNLEDKECSINVLLPSDCSNEKLENNDDIEKLNVSDVSMCNKSKLNLKENIDKGTVGRKQSEEELCKEESTLKLSSNTEEEVSKSASILSCSNIIDSTETNREIEITMTGQININNLEEKPAVSGNDELIKTVKDSTDEPETKMEVIELSGSDLSDTNVIPIEVEKPVSPDTQKDLDDISETIKVQEIIMADTEINMEITDNTVTNNEIIDIADEKDEEYVTNLSNQDICNMEIEANQDSISKLGSVVAENIEKTDMKSSLRSEEKNSNLSEEVISTCINEKSDINIQDEKLNKNKENIKADVQPKTIKKRTLSHISKLSNTLDILSDDDDDVVMLSDDEISHKSNKIENLVESECIEKNTESTEHFNLKLKDIDALDICENKTDNITEPHITDSNIINNELPEQVDKEKEKKVEKAKKPLLPTTFLKTCKTNLAEMTRDNLEEFCILKIVESVVDRSNFTEISSQLSKMASMIEDYKKKANTLLKQNRDLQVVLKSVQEEQKKFANSPITPMKITRSVGMQVFLTEKPGVRKKAVSPNTLPNNQTNKTVKSQSNQVNSNAKSPKVQPVTSNSQNIPVPRLVPANNTNSPIKVQTVAAPKPATPNGVKNSPPVQKAEKRTHSKIQNNSVTVDLTDDEPPAKIAQRNITPPVRLVSQQSLLATQRAQFPNNLNNTPRKVFIPIGTPQSPVRPGQAIMLKSMGPQGPRMRPSLVPKPGPSNAIRARGARHPPPLPDGMKQYQPPNWKELPPSPELKLAKADNGIVISWNIQDYREERHEEIASYQLYAYQETSSPPNTNLWKKIGDVKALPLPMACTLTQFMAGYKYYFAVRAVDIRSRLGPFSLPGSILLLNKM